MSTCRQAIAARRKSAIDVRYRGLKSGDVAISRRRLEAKINREKTRAGRKAKKGKS